MRERIGARTRWLGQGAAGKGGQKSRARSTAAGAALLVVLGALIWIGSSSSAAADQSQAYAYPEVTQRDIEEASRSGNLGGGVTEEGIEGELTDPEAAEELPHSDLDREEALELLTEVFEEPLESIDGPYDELQVKRFISNDAAVIAAGEPSESLGLSVGEEPGNTGPTLLQSSSPLRTENAAGKEEAVDLGLEDSEGELRPANPLAEVGFPEQLGEGIQLGVKGDEEPVSIHLVTGAGERAPSTVDESVAVYPNVDTDTDLAVAPTPEGLETLTQLRSAQAPTSETFRLELPEGATLEAVERGAEVRRADGKPLVKILPPSAIDAEGAAVPVTMSVSEENLTLQVSTDKSTRFPVLVDPMYQTYQWYELTTTQGTGDFVVESNEPSLLTGTFWSAAMPNPGTYLNSPGLYVQAHANTAINAGADAGWSYYVPRLKSDERTYHDPPHTYVSAMHIHDLGFFTEKEANGQKYSDGGSNPHLWSGIWDGVNSTWPSSYIHDGPEGQITNFGAEFNFWSSDQNGKVAQPINLSTYAWRWMGENWREAYAGYVQIEVSEAENTRNPTWGELEGTGWVNTVATRPLIAPASDLGIGVRRVWFEGTGAGTIVSAPSCSGLASSPCPRIYTATNYGYEPAKMSQGVHWLNVNAEDVLGNRAETTSIPVRVDHTAPTLSVTGSITEQATRGAGLEKYSVKINGADGTTAAPQSGVVKSVVKVDGKVEDAYSPGCAASNCELAHEWQLEADKYGSGTHTVEVIVTDGVGLSTSRTIPIELHPDHLSPVVVLSGTMTEQESIGTTRPRYVLKASATDPPETSSYAPTYSSSFGSSGTGNGQFAHPADVALDSKGDLWVADENNNRLEEFNEKGEFMKSVGSSGAGNGQFTRPKSIAFAAGGNFWVADSGNNRLEEFNAGGEFLKAVGSAGSGNGQFSGPEGIAIDAKGDIWVSDTYNYRVQELNEKGEFVKLVNPSGLGAIEPTGIAAGPGGNVWVTDWAHDRIVELGESGELVRQVGSEGTGNGQFRQPDAVAIDPGGNVWVGDQNNERVQEFNQKGEYVAKFGSSGTGAGQFSLSYPMGIAVDSKGDIWVTDTNDNRVERWALPGGTASGVASVSIKVDGKVVSSTAPGCPAGGCSISREWTLTSGSYGVGQHTIEVTATDAAGHSTTEHLTIHIARDETAPTITSNSAFFNAPEGWVEQQTYPYTASVSDSGYGVTSVVLKIDGATVNPVSQACTNGGCSETLSGAINTASYSGGAHSAELIATDGAGNTARRTWSMNVDPDGTITSGEATDTLEALEHTSEGAPVASTEELLDPEQMELGDDPELVRSGETIESEGVPDSTTITTEPKEGFTISGPEGSIGIKPVGGSGGSAPVIAEEVAAVSGNTQGGVDTVVRPEYNGALAFEEIREPSSPERFSWTVRLGTEKELVDIDEHFAEVRWIEGPRAFLITAEEAHDATGKAVATSLAIENGDVLTLTVHHRVPGVVYPVLAGQSYETSYHPAEVIGPLTNPEPIPSAEAGGTEAEDEALDAAEPLTSAELQELTDALKGGSGPHRDPNKPVPLKLANHILRRHVTQRTVSAPAIASVGGPGGNGTGGWEKFFHVAAFSCSDADCDIWHVHYADETDFSLDRTGSTSGNREYAAPHGGVHCGSEVEWWWSFNVEIETVKAGTRGPNEVNRGSGEHLTYWCKYHERVLYVPTLEDTNVDTANTVLIDQVYPNGYQSIFTQNWNTGISEE